MFVTHAVGKIFIFLKVKMAKNDLKIRNFKGFKGIKYALQGFPK